MIKFNEWILLRENMRDAVWLRGTAKGFELGQHDSIWGTLDHQEAKDYANQFGNSGEQGTVSHFKLNPQAKVLEVAGDKIALISKLYNWNPQQQQQILTSMKPGGQNADADHRSLIQQMGGKPNAPWDLTQMDTLLAQKLKSSGYDAAIMGGEWKGQIVVVNKRAITMVQPADELNSNI